MDEIVFSIVIPVYNASKYLGHCLDSILSQDFRLFELILVDDGSKDESLHICKKYAALDERVIVIHKNNGGPSSARNIGIKKSNGRYILFIDSDDWVDSNYLSKAYELIKNKDADLYVLGFIVDYSSRIEVFELKERFYVKKQICDFIDTELKKRHWGNPWNKIFKKDIIQFNNIIFDESINYSEDALFNFCYVNCCNSVYSSNITSYHYRNIENQGSLSKRILQFKENQEILNKLLLEGMKLSSNEEWRYTLNTYLLNEMILWLLKCPKDKYLKLNVEYFLENIPRGKFHIYVLSGIKGFILKLLINTRSPYFMNFILKHRK